MSTQQTPSAGAMRAATEIQSAICQGLRDVGYNEVGFNVSEDMAAIIDRETGAAELAKELKDCIAFCEILMRSINERSESPYWNVDSELRDSRAALAKWEGKK